MREDRRMGIPEKAIASVATMMRMLGNENRLRILNALHERPKTWTELIFELRINSNTLKHHLDYLREKKLVIENEPQGFRLTDAGKSFMELSIEDIISTVEKAKEIIGEPQKTD